MDKKSILKKYVKGGKGGPITPATGKPVDPSSYANLGKSVGASQGAANASDMGLKKGVGLSK